MLINLICKILIKKFKIWKLNIWKLFGNLKFGIWKLDQKGFSLLELLLVIAILVIIAGVVSPFLFGGKISTEVEEEARKIASVLRLTQNKAITMENSSAWGVRFDNVTSTEPFYALFYGNSYSTGTTTDSFYLASGISYGTPASGTSTEAVFNKRTGNLSSATTTNVIIKSTNPEIIKTITISPNGRITNQ